jgi:hypothetical protein
MPKPERGARATPRGLVSGRAVRFAQAWGPPIAWMAVLFLVSAWPGAELGFAPSSEWIARKCAHFGGYAALAALLFRALLRSDWPSPPAAALAALLLAGIYGFSDETHQMYVPARTGTWVDVGIDTAGAALGVAAALWRTSRRGRWPKS